MREAHELSAWVLIVVNAIAGFWCLAVYRWPNGDARIGRRSTWGLVIVANAMAFVQAVLGAILSRQPGVELGDMHALYGFSAIVAVMIMYGYRTSPFMRGKELLMYGLGCLFIMGLGLRNLYLR
jgi:hypothetical protein